MIKKTLVFRFFVPKEYKDNIAIRMHLECLKMYSHIFDSAIFSLCFEDDDATKIGDVEKDIIECGFKNDVRFVVDENSPYTESLALKKFVIDELENIEGLVFFGHTKGVKNVKTYPNNIDNLMKWVYCLYFYSLEFLDEVEKQMIFCFPYPTTFYGPLMTTFDDGSTFHFPGTFYWLNTKSLFNDVKSGVVNIPLLSNRTFAENLPFIYKRTNICHAVSGHKDIWMKYYDLYNGNLDLVVDFFGEKDDFIKKYNEIIDKIK